MHRFPALQPEHIIVRDAACYPQQLQSALTSINSEGFDIVLDAISGEYFQPSYQALTKGGRHVIFGAANWTPTGTQADQGLVTCDEALVLAHAVALLGCNAGDKPGWLRLAWQYLRRPMLDPTSMIGDNKSVMAFNLIWMFDKVHPSAWLP